MTHVGTVGSLALPDGRTVEYWDGGDPAGSPVVLQPGTPSGRLQGMHAHDAAVAAGVRLVSVSRPGYGGSTLAPPGLAVVGHDAVAVAGQLGLGAFATLGISGGGPYALATGAAGGDRVTRVGVLAGIGPWPEVDPPSEADAAERRWLQRARAGDLAAATDGFRADAVQAFDAMLALDDDAMVAEFMAGLPPGEGTLFDAPGRAIWAADLRDALSTYDGFVRDNLSWGLPWDIDLAEVRRPVHLWYGERDRMVPAAHGHWLAERLPDAHLLVLAGDGHGRTTFGHWSEVFRTLLRRP